MHRALFAIVCLFNLTNRAWADKPDNRPDRNGTPIQCWATAVDTSVLGVDTVTYYMTMQASPRSDGQRDCGG